ncbi:aminoglycoside phosphotransferase family protein [Hafnia alvei]|uniref:Streptomycin 6-kinase n=1 Tax=Hafnia alvei TaxID=569 RepID=A0A1C6YXH2_HAFAL|nr:aminoglycoside phosphotransferase family protein [Hafnia alvei]NLS54376.1 phosphotransferase [Hafnia alvei]SCM51554.1 streptomycin 6-kinase [Hafnia alvei]
MFSDWLTRWNLQADGAVIETHSSQLLPVLCDGIPLMLKLALVEEERCGADLMQWWNGNGAAKVVAHHNEALLMERACGAKNLLHMAKHSQDDEASQIMCRVVTQLHACREETAPPLEALHQRFTALRKAASLPHDPLLSVCCRVAETLLSSPQDEVVLHGDIHHGNILDFGERGWLAIDPKGLFGERGYDYANLFCNPELVTCTQRERFLRQLTVVTQAANLDRQRLLMWIMAYAGLSAAWFLEDNELDYVVSRMSIARFAADALGI